MRESWPHAPPHYFTPHGTYIITAATLHRRPTFNSDAKLHLLRNTVFELARNYALILQAWAFFGNHYHLLASFENTKAMHRDFVQHLRRVVGRVTPCAPVVEVGMRRAEDCPPYLKCYGVQRLGLKATRDRAL